MSCFQSPLFSTFSGSSFLSLSNSFMMRFPKSFSMISRSGRSAMFLGNFRFFFFFLGF